MGDWIAAGIDTGFDSSTGLAEVATNWDMVDERDFGYPSGELQVKLLYWDSVLWLIYKLWHDVAVLPVPTTRV